jgi:hypothetical protein
MSISTKTPFSFPINATEEEDQNGVKMIAAWIDASILKKIIKVPRFDWRASLTDQKPLYQRRNDDPRKNRISKEIRDEGIDTLYLPGALILNSRSPWTIANGQITITDYLYAVDGGTRAGFLEKLMALDVKPLDPNYRIHVTIMRAPAWLEKALFPKVNKVKPLSAALKAADAVSSLYHKPLHTLTIPQRDELVAMLVIEKLAKTPRQPFYNVLLMPEEPMGNKVTTTVSMLTAMKRLVKQARTLELIDDDRENADDQRDYLFKLMKDFWTSLSFIAPNAFANPKRYIYQQSIGVVALSDFLGYYLLEKMQREGNIKAFNQSNFTTWLTDSTRKWTPILADEKYWTSSNLIGSSGALGGKIFKDLTGVDKKNMKN